MRPADHDRTRYGEVERLLSLAHDMLDDGREQIVRDYLRHAIAALDRIREVEGAHPAATQSS